MGGAGGNVGKQGPLEYRINRPQRPEKVNVELISVYTIAVGNTSKVMPSGELCYVSYLRDSVTRFTTLYIQTKFYMGPKFTSPPL